MKSGFSREKAVPEVPTFESSSHSSSAETKPSVRLKESSKSSPSLTELLMLILPARVAPEADTEIFGTSVTVSAVLSEAVGWLCVFVLSPMVKMSM